MRTSSRAVTSTARPASARDLAATVLYRVEAEGAFANILLHLLLEDAHLSPADSGLATEIVLGTLRYQGRIDWTLTEALRYRLAELPPRIRAILRSAVFQLLFLHRVPARAVVHEAVELARRYGHAGTAGLVNAVLRRIAAKGERPLPDPEPDPVDRIAVEHSHPRWLVGRWIARWGRADAVALCQANNAPAPVMARVNTLRASPREAAEQLAASGVTVRPTVLPEGLRLEGSFTARHELVRRGWLTAQDLGAMLVTHALDPQPGETVIDACAAPGGKATHIAERMRNQGNVLACDIHPGKLQSVRQRATDLGIDVIETYQQDARKLGTRWAGVADRLVIDAPCTGLGVVRRRPEIRWRVRPADLKIMASLQREIILGACDAARPGGVLLYSVCSTEPEEGWDVVEWFLRERPEFVPESDLPMPQTMAARTTEPAGTIMLLPHRHGTDGFFLARLRRR